MNGREFASFVEITLAEKGIKKGDFYKDTGISATALYGWKRGSTPSVDTVSVIEKYLGVSFDDKESVQTLDSETAELLEDIRNRQDLRILLNSARHIPPSSVYSLISQLEKEKERNTE